MAINTNALTLGGSLPAKGSFQTRGNGPGSSPVANDPGTDADPNAQTSGTAAGGQPAAGDTALQAPSAAAKSSGPSAQTRANARSSGAPAPSAPAGTAPDPATDAADDSDRIFSSVMATALGRSATIAAAPQTPAASSKAGTRAADSGAAQPAATPADAVAWIAQVLMPATAAQPGATPGAGNLPGSSAAASASATAIAPAAPAPAAAALLPGLGNGATTGANSTAAAAAALRNPISDPSSPQAPLTQQDATQTPAVPAQTDSAATLGSITAMADVQKLISGMTAATGAAADDTNDDSAGTPAPHAGSSASADGAPTAAALQAAGLTRSDSSVGHVTLSIQAPVASAGFAEEVSARVAGLAQAGVTQAQLQLSPADLGPVQVHITLQSGQASVWFGANHADTRAALEQSLPRLRELFAGAGMPLTDSGVFREPPQQPQTQSLPAAASANAGDDAVAASTVTPVSNIRLTLLDTYA